MSKHKGLESQVLADVRGGMSRGEAAEKYGLSPITVNGYCRRAGLSRHRWITPETAQTIARLRAEGHTIEDVAKTTGYSAPAVTATLQRMGLVKPRRPQDPEVIAELAKAVAGGEAVSTASRRLKMSPATAAYYLR